MKFKQFASEALAAYLDAWRKYTGFSGRTTRKDYWGFVLTNMLVAFVIGLAEKIVGMDDGFISSLYTLAVICPNICLCTRRLHDVGKSGWWQLAIIIPFLNIYYAYLLWIKPGDEGPNKFGAPVGTAAAAAQPVYGAYSVPVENEFSAHEMCPVPKPETVAEPAPQAARCAACGTALEAGAKFCSECGTPTNK